MVEITDFTETPPTPDIADFSEEDTRVKTANDASIKNLAVRVAALSPEDDPLAVYNSINGELGENGTSETADNVVTMAKTRKSQAEKEAVVDLIGDAAIDLEVRGKIAKEFANKKEEDSRLNVMIAEESGAQDSSPFETRGEERQRVDLVGAIKEVDDYQAYVQRELNAETLKNTPGFWSPFADFLELVAPFAEQTALTKVVTLLRKGDQKAAVEAFVLMGNGKTGLRDWFQNMPISEQRKTAPLIFEMVKASDTIVMSETNDFMRNDFLKAIMEPGYYGGGSEFLDNAASVLDSVGLGWTLKTWTKGALATRKLAKIKGTEKVRKDKPFSPETEAPIAEKGDVNPFQTNVDEVPIAVRYDIPENNIDKVQVKKTIVRSSVQPQSLSGVYKHSNPEKARGLHALVTLDKTDGAARALYGTSRAEAIASDLLPEISHSGSMSSKLSEPNALVAQFDVISGKTAHLEDARRYAENPRGGTEYRAKEKDALAAIVKNDFQGVTGLVPRKELFGRGSIASPESIKAFVKGDTIVAQGVYGAADGGIRNAQNAVDLAKHSFAEYGIDEGSITLLTRKGANYVPVKSNIPLNTLPDGDFLIRVDYKSKIKPHEIDFDDIGDVKKNWLDYNAWTNFTGRGSLMSHILDPQSMLDPIVTRGLSVAVEKTAKLKSLLGNASKQLQEGFKGLTPERARYLEALFKEANHKEFDITPAKASSRRLTVGEWEIAKLWKNYWDVEWHLSNTLWKAEADSKGYWLYADGKANTNILARPLGQPKGKTKEAFSPDTGEIVRAGVFDPDTGKIIRMAADEVKEFYEAGGQFAKMRTKMSVDGESTKTLMSRNSVGGGYLRKMNDGDALLVKKPGYFHITHINPWFIGVKDAKTGKVSDIVMSAKNQSLAEVQTKMLNSNAADGVVYEARLAREETTMTGDKAWESVVASGRSSQKYRGDSVGDASGSSSIEGAHIMGPGEAMETSIHAIASQTEMRPVIEAVKRRFISSLGHVFPKHKKTGTPQYPTDTRQFEGGTATERANARTIWEYIRNIEDGHINDIDEITRWSLRGLADVIGGRNNPVLDWGEEFMRKRARGAGISSVAKKKVFQLYLALNPIRQLIVQSHQAVQIGGIETRFFLKDLMPQMMLLTTMERVLEKGAGKIGGPLAQASLKLSGISTVDAVQMVKHWEASGLKEAVDTHNLVRADWSFAAKDDAVSRLDKVVDIVPDFFQKLGFDAGERANIKSAWLTFRHRAMKRGEDMNDPHVADKVVAEARNFTYNMNRAGDLPYNQNGFAVALQFLQVPHKALTQVFFNRTLSGAEKSRMALFNTLAYGAPGLDFIQRHFGDVLPDEPWAREPIVKGLESVLFNFTLSAASGHKTDIDFSNLAPNDASGLMDTVHTLTTSGLGPAIMEAPITQLMKNGGRVNKLLLRTSRLFGGARDYSEPTTLVQVAEDFLNLSSGWNNFSKGMKAQYLQKVNVALGSYGNQVAASNWITNLAKVAGFRTYEESTAYAESHALNQPKHDQVALLTEVYKDYKRHYKDLNKPLEFLDHTSDVFNEIFRMGVERNALTTKTLDKLIRRDLKDRDAVFYKQLMRSQDYMDEGKLRDVIRKSDRLSEDRKKVLVERLYELEKSRNRVAEEENE